MRLSFSGAPEVGAPIANVWPRIIDPHFVARHGPGAESVEVLDPRQLKVITAFGVGSMRLRFGIDVELVDVNPPNFLTMKARGRAPGSAVEVTAELGLEPIDPTRTRLSWKADTDISGSAAGIGEAGAAAAPPYPESPPGPAASAAPPPA